MSKSAARRSLNFAESVPKFFGDWHRAMRCEVDEDAALRSRCDYRAIVHKLMLDVPSQSIKLAHPHFADEFIGET
jgi:hypothetical protein